MSDTPKDRRGFLADQFKGLGRLFMAAINNTITNASGGRKYLRPPGAIDETAFLLTCERCGKCGEACPVGAIKYLKPDAGAAVGTPYVAVLEQPCELCLDCTRACPSGALMPLLATREVKMGVARLNTSTCWAYNSQPCDICYNKCPLPDEAIKLEDGKPVIIDSGCTGCGICAYACVNTPSCIEIEPAR